MYPNYTTIYLLVKSPFHNHVDSLNGWSHEKSQCFLCKIPLNHHILLVKSNYNTTFSWLSPAKWQSPWLIPATSPMPSLSVVSRTRNCRSSSAAAAPSQPPASQASSAEVSTARSVAATWFRLGWKLSNGWPTLQALPMNSGINYDMHSIHRVISGGTLTLVRWPSWLQ